MNSLKFTFNSADSINYNSNFSTVESTGKKGIAQAVVDIMGSRTLFSKLYCADLNSLRIDEKDMLKNHTSSSFPLTFVKTVFKELLHSAFAKINAKLDKMGGSDQLPKEDQVNGSVTQGSEENELSEDQLGVKIDIRQQIREWSKDDEDQFYKMNDALDEAKTPEQFENLKAQICELRFNKIPELKGAEFLFDSLKGRMNDEERVSSNFTSFEEKNYRVVGDAYEAIEWLAAVEGKIGKRQIEQSSALNANERLALLEKILAWVDDDKKPTMIKALNRNTSQDVDYLKGEISKSRHEKFPMLKGAIEKFKELEPKLTDQQRKLGSVEIEIFMNDGDSKSATQLDSALNWLKNL